MPLNIEPDEIYTAEELAAKFKRPRRDLYDWYRRGTGPAAFKIGRRLAYEGADVIDWYEKRKAATGRGGVKP